MFEIAANIATLLLVVLAVMLVSHLSTPEKTDKQGCVTVTGHNGIHTAKYCPKDTP